jgi:multisubunit Na+/H+ antiporter MnhF subunit
MKVAGTGQGVFCFSIATLFYTVPSELFQYSNSYMYANLALSISLLSFFGVYYYSRHFILEAKFTCFKFK